MNKKTTTISSIVAVKTAYTITIGVAKTDDDLDDEGFLQCGKGLKFASLNDFRKWANGKSNYIVEHFALKSSGHYTDSADKIMKYIELSEVIKFLDDNLVLHDIVCD